MKKRVKEKVVTGSLHIGWARGDITPPRKTLLAGQFYTRLSEGVLTPITATALALEVQADNGKREQVLFLSCDLAHERFKADLLRELEGRCPELDLSKLTVNCTHTHTAPGMVRGVYEEPDHDPSFMNPDEFRLWLAARLADVVVEAWSSRKQGGLSRGFAYAVAGRSRRAVYADGTALMYGETAREDFCGFESRDDHAVNLLFTHDMAGELTGMVVNLACPAQCQEHLLKVAADYWHDVRVALADRHGDHVYLLPQCAPAGDMSPHLLAYRKEEQDLRDRLGLDDRGVVARRIIAAVEEGLATASAVEHDVILMHAVRRLRLPRLLVTSQQLEQEQAMLAMNEEERKQLPWLFQRPWPFRGASDLISRYRQQTESTEYEIEMHVVRLGDVVFAGNPFELYIDYAWRMRCRSRALQTFLVQLADGSGAYLPTERAMHGGHYSAVIKSNWVGPEGGRVLVDRTVDAINELFETEDYPRAR